MSNMIDKISFLTIIFLSNFMISQNEVRIKDHLKESTHINGKESYLNSPFVTSGRRTYMVGYQDGSFPEIGWHINGEMGGIWNHPIKLFDGVAAEVIIEQDSLELNNAALFTNYPYASLHSFNFAQKQIEIERWQFVSDTTQSLAIQFILKNTGSESRNLKFNFSAYSDLRPTWLGERTNMVDSPDRAVYHGDHDYWIINDSINPWSAVFKADRKSDYHQNVPKKYRGMGTGTLLGYDLSIEPGESEMITFFLAGSYTSVSNSLKDLNHIKDNLKSEITYKKEKYKQIAQNSKLTIPDKNIQQTFEWLKYNCEWLVQTVPEIGTGITAGIPDYPWWFGVDSEYA